MVDLFYRETTSGRQQTLSPGYTIAALGRSRSIFRSTLAVIAAGGMLTAAIGLFAGIVTPSAWAAGVFVVGVSLFTASGYLSRHADKVRHRSVQWRPIT